MIPRSFISRILGVASMGACFAFGLVLAWAQTYISPPPAPTSIVPNVITSTGQITTSLGLSNGTSISGTSTTTVGSVASFSYDPTTYALTNSATIQLSGGYSFYYFSGTGLIATATIQLPASPSDGNTARLILPAGLTITSLAIDSGAGVSVATFASITLGSTSLIFQWRSASGQCVCWSRVQ